jgi:hypothetical protein
MSTPEVVITGPTLGEHGQTCKRCGASLSSDQRYCLNCGEPRAAARVPYCELLDADDNETAAAAPLPRAAATFWTGQGGTGWNPVVALVGVAVIAVVLGVGVLIGRSVSSSTKRASAPQVITVGGAAGPATTGATAPTATFKGDWPAGKDGYTVQLQALPKAGTQPAAVAAAKRAASGKGATAVGGLDSDQYPSLDGGNYVVYSGIYKTQAEAGKALKGLKKAFPQAQVIHVSQHAAAATGSGKTVSRQQLNQLNSTSGSDYYKKSSKLPKKIAIPGPPPAPDKKAPGGGSGVGETIG